jgi:parallel beta-helix repeat protein
MKTTVRGVSAVQSALLLLIGMGIRDAWAQTEVAAGNVSGAWESSASPYHVNGDVTVPKGETLTIEPGTEVVFTGHFRIQISGRLLAVGMPGDSIVFRAQNEKTGWRGLRFTKTPSTNDSSKIMYCVIQNGVASSSGDNIGGGILVDTFGKLLCIHCSIRKNRTVGDLYSGGAGIAIYNCSPVIMNNTISLNNAAGGHGGGIFVYGNSNPTLSNNVISRNQATGGGGAAFYQCNPVMVNNTITGNSAEHGGGVDCIQTSPRLFNTILYGNTSVIGAQAHLATPSEPGFYFCDVQGGTAAFARDHAPGGGFHGAYESNLDANPLFFDTVKYDFSLSDASPCIGAGSDSVRISNTSYQVPETDFGGNPRPSPAGSRPDIGAFENPSGDSGAGISESPDPIPDHIQLYQNYPNPFNPATVIGYSVVHDDLVNLKVYDVKGREVAVLVRGVVPAGTHEVEFSAGNLAGGVYFYRIEAGSYEHTGKMLLVR